MDEREQMREMVARYREVRRSRRRSVLGVRLSDARLMTDAGFEALMVEMLGVSYEALGNIRAARPLAPRS